jgi:CO dehydrogenase/acetyl-CoA synthase gamma subunit (corrinoid Fe-S protein)
MSGALRNKTPVETAVEIAAQKALPAQKTKEAQAQLNKETMTGAISNFLNAANEAESVGAFAGSKKQSILRSALNAFETGTGKLGEGVAATFDKDVNEKRNALQTFGAQLMSLMKTATGATASQMNSDADIKLARQAFEANDYETFKKVLPVLEKRYGLGTLTVPGPSAKERYNKMFGGQ